MYHDWHAVDGREWYTLAEVRAFQVAGEVFEIRAPELGRWHVRLLYEAGIIRLPVVKAYRLWPEASEAERGIYRGFLLLIRCRWLNGPGTPAPFSERFAGRWCGVSRSQAREATAKLVTRGYLSRRKVRSQKGRREWRYLPAHYHWPADWRDDI